MSESNSILFDSLSSIMSKGFSKDIRSFLEGMDSIRKCLGIADSSINLSASHEKQQRWSVEQEIEPSALMDRDALARSADYAQIPMVSANKTTY